MTPARFTMLRSLFSCMLAWLGLTASAATAADPLPTVPHVDLARYAGTWHEMARLPNWFQRSCEKSPGSSPGSPACHRRCSRN